MIVLPFYSTTDAFIPELLCLAAQAVSDASTTWTANNDITVLFLVLKSSLLNSLEKSFGLWKGVDEHLFRTVYLMGKKKCLDSVSSSLFSLLQVPEVRSVDRESEIA